jgi:DNA-binding MarR family transcriptional regulator
MTRLDASFGFHLSRLANALRAALETRLRPFDLTAPQWAVLMRLGERDTWPQRQLGASLGMDKATVGGVILRLERKHLIRRHRDGGDARVMRVSLSEDGRRLADATAACGEAVNAQALADFDGGERDAVVVLLRRALVNLDNIG